MWFSKVPLHIPLTYATFESPMDKSCNYDSNIKIIAHLIQIAYHVLNSTFLQKSKKNPLPPPNESPTFYKPGRPRGMSTRHPDQTLFKCSATPERSTCTLLMTTCQKNQDLISAASSHLHYRRWEPRLWRIQITVQNHNLKHPFLVFHSVKLLDVVPPLVWDSFVYFSMLVSSEILQFEFLVTNIDFKDNGFDQWDILG